MSNIKSITVVGLGYIGLPTAAMFAAKGLSVHGVDVNPIVVDTINRGEIHIVEPGLKKIVARVVLENNLKASREVEVSDAYIIAVPTPFINQSKEPDLTYIAAAVHNIARVLKKGDLIVLESTSPVGTTEKISEWLHLERPDLTFPHIDGENSDIRVVYCPERVLPGNIIHELVHNDRILGGVTKLCAEIGVGLYEKLVVGRCSLTNTRTAEMAKLAENSYRDVNIAFANELSMLCDDAGIDTWELIKLANLHPRVNILSPGPGVGGHCIAVDPWFIIAQNPEKSELVRTAREVNLNKVEHVIRQISVMAKTSDINNIICFGLTYKPDIDDLRESPAKIIFDRISQMFPGRVCAIDPRIGVDVDKSINTISVNEALSKSSNLLIGLVAHSEFRGIFPRESNNLDFTGIFRKNGIS